jgi:hypothetical protein
MPHFFILLNTFIIEVGFKSSDPIQQLFCIQDSFMMQTSTRHIHDHQDLPSLRPEELNYSSTPCRELSIPTELFFPAISPSSYREIGFRVIAKPCGHISRATQNPETRWVLVPTLLRSCRGVPYREIGIHDVTFTGTTNPRLPNSDVGDTRQHQMLSLWDPSQFGVSRFLRQ